MGWWFFPDLLVMVVRGGDGGVCVWVVAMGFGG